MLKKITTVPKSKRAKLNKITNELATPVPEKQKTDKLFCYEGTLPKSYRSNRVFKKVYLFCDKMDSKSTIKNLCSFTVSLRRFKKVLFALLGG